jgi:quercetin dioxygenase-like cupin family protein
MSTTTTSPVHTFAESETIAFLGEVLAIRLTTEQAGGGIALMEHLMPQGLATPLHLQPDEDELFYVLEGRLSVWLDGEVSVAAAGDVVWLPRNRPHPIRVDSERARVLGVSVPGGHERFFRLAGEPAAAYDLDALPAAPPDLERMGRAAAATGVDIIGPPPFDAA